MPDTNRSVQIKAWCVHQSDSGRRSKPADISEADSRYTLDCHASVLSPIAMVMVQVHTHEHLRCGAGKVLRALCHNVLGCAGKVRCVLGRFRV